MNTIRTLKVAAVAATVLFAGTLSTAVFAQGTDLSQQVKSAWAQDPELKGAVLRADEKGGRIIISGSMTEEQEAAAYRDAVSVPGMTSVLNFISITDLA
jgi:osmotically-inducible protein OsmY